MNFIDIYIYVYLIADSAPSQTDRDKEAQNSEAVGSECHSQDGLEQPSMPSEEHDDGLPDQRDLMMNLALMRTVLREAFTIRPEDDQNKKISKPQIWKV